MPTEEQTEQPAQSTVLQPVEVKYCAVCSFPPEYCEFGEHLTKCKEWLEVEDPDLYSKFYSDEALQAKIGTMSLEAQRKLEEDVQKAEKKAEKKLDAAQKKQQESRVTIKLIERTKRKHDTCISGLEAFGINLKDAAKNFGKKFATGASVKKNPQGKEEIIIQGDVVDGVMDLIGEQTGFLKSVPEDNVDIVEDKK